MAVTAPTALTYGTVTHTLVAFSGDTDDPGILPDLNGMVGIVTATAAVQSLRAATLPAEVVIDPIEGIYNDQGVLCTPNDDGTPGTPGLRLPASDCAAFATTHPDGFAYDFTFKLRHPSGKRRDFAARTNVVILEDETIDLALVGNVPGAPPIGTAAAEAAAAASAASATQAAEAAQDAADSAAAAEAALDDGVNLIQTTVTADVGDTDSDIGGAIADLIDDATSGKLNTADLTTQMATRLGTNGNAARVAVADKVAADIAGGGYAPGMTPQQAVDTRVTGLAPTSPADPYTLQRLDRQSLAAAVTGAGFARTTYDDAENITDDFANLSKIVAATNAQVSGNRLYTSTSTNPGGGIIRWPVTTGENFRFTTHMRFKPGGSSNAFYLGVDTGTAGHAPVANHPDGLFIGINSAGARATFKGSSVSGITMTEVLKTGADPTIETNYRATIVGTVHGICLSLTDEVNPVNNHIALITWADLTAAGRTVNNITMHGSDARGTSGHSFGPYAIARSLQPTRIRKLGNQDVQGLGRSHYVYTATAGGDGRHLMLPASYDSRAPTDLVVYLQQSLTGSQHTFATETRMENVTAAIANAGMAMLGIQDTSTDQWGNDASLANYLAAVAFVRSRYNIGQVFLLGISMGGGTALNLLTHRDFPTPAAVAMIGGVGDLDTLFNGNVGAWAPGIRAAYGIASNGSDYESKTVGHNPADRAGWEFRGVPLRFYTSTGDTSVPKASNADAIAAKVAGYSPEAAVVLGSGGHLDASQFQGSDLVTFFNRYR